MADNLRETLELYRAKADIAWSEYKDGVYSNKEYKDGLKRLQNQAISATYRDLEAMAKLMTDYKPQVKGGSSVTRQAIPLEAIKRYFNVEEEL